MQIFLIFKNILSDLGMDISQELNHKIIFFSISIGFFNVCNNLHNNTL